MSLPSSFLPSIVTLWFVTASLPLFTETARPALCRNSSRSFWTEENKANWENVPPSEQVFCCGCDSSVAGTWSWASRGGQGSWSLPRGLQAADPILRRARGVWHAKPGTVRSLRSRHPAPGDTAEGLVQAKEKIPTAIREVEMPPFSLSPPHPRERWAFAVLRPPAADGRGVVPLPLPLVSSRPSTSAADWRKDFSLVAGWGQCSLRAAFRRLWALGKHLYRAASSILFVRPVSPSAIVITSAVRIWLRLWAAVSQGCP